ncbi:MAG: hypothetical protein ACRDY7_05505 [Acidimicrobiia bacterium]
MTNRSVLVSLGLAFLLVVGACGDSSSDDSEAANVDATENGGPESGGAATDLQDLMLASATKAAEETTSRFEGTVTTPGPDGQPFELTMSGVSDTAKPRLSIDMDLGAIAGEGTSGVMKTILDGEVIYMRFPEAMLAGPGGGGLPGGKPWIRMDLDAAAEASGLNLGALLEQSKQADPSSYVALLTGASDDITEVGTEEVRGTATRHFKLTIDPAKMLEQAPPELKEAGKSLTATYGGTKIPAEVWIGEDDSLPRRISYRMDLASIEGAEAAGLGAGTITASIDIFDYGTPVDITIPPAAETTDLADVLGAGAGGGGTTG